MRTALKSTPPVGIPGAVPPGAQQPAAPAGQPEAMPLPATLSQMISSVLTPPPTPARSAPQQLGRSGAPVAIARPAAEPAQDPNSLLPPASIPNRQANQAPEDDRNLLQKLFGG